MRGMRYLRFIFALIIALVLILALTNFTLTPTSAQYTGAAALPLQITPTPASDDGSEIGSTDGILIMGIVIVLIVILPMLFRKKGN